MSKGKSGSHNAHFLVSPSGAKQWLHCPASINAVEEAKAEGIISQKESSSPYAAEGTRAHDYAEEILRGEKSIEEIPEEFRAPVSIYTDHCFELAELGEPMVEVEAPLFYAPQGKGTVDFAVVCDGKLIIRDLKYGQGIKVHATQNEQLAIYARSILEALDNEFEDDDEVSIGIVQPRFRDGSDPVSTWEITVAELKEFTNPIGKIAKKILKGKLKNKFHASEDTCRWCKIKEICNFRTQTALDVLPDDLDDLDFSDTKDTSEVVDSISDDQLVTIYKNTKFITSVLKDVETRLKDRVLSGEDIKGIKSVLGRKPNKKWKDESEFLKWSAGKMLKDDVTNVKPITPTKVLAMIKDDIKLTSRGKNQRMKAIEAMIVDEEPKPTIAPEGDKRPELEIKASLEVLDDEDILDEIDDLF